MRIASITAGAAGMYCGSCLHDNTLASALHALGHDALLVPTYTPIRTDEPDVSERRVFLGSQNFSIRSLQQNRELGLITSTKTVVQAIQNTFAKDFAGATPW